MKDNRFFDKDFDDLRLRDKDSDFDFEFRNRDRDDDCDDFDFCEDCDDRDRNCERDRCCVRDHDCRCRDRDDECDCEKDRDDCDRDRDREDGDDCERDRDRDCRCRDRERDCDWDRERDDCERDRDRDCRCRDRDRDCDWDRDGDECDRDWRWEQDRSCRGRRNRDCCEGEVFCSERFDFNEDERFGCRSRRDAAHSRRHWFEDRDRFDDDFRNRRMSEEHCKFCKRLKCRIMVLELALQDTILFLDTHPCDWEALCYYRQIRRHIVRLERLYERRCGPLTNQGVNTEFGWEWTKCPFPWEGRE